ncbi:MAG: putative bifunctional diguanylate cyclase/phosphodiesterase [Geminicoccaceae bacterium]
MAISLEHLLGANSHHQDLSSSHGSFGSTILFVSVDVVSILAYLSIAVTLVILLKRRRDFRQVWTIAPAVLFLACWSTHHLAQMVPSWHADFGFQAFTHLTNALLAIAMALVSWSALPRVLALPSRREIEQRNIDLEAEVKRRRIAEDELCRTQELLEFRVEERTRQLRESEERLKLALDSAKGALIDLNVVDGICHYDARGHTMLGYKPGEMPLTKEHFLERIHPDDRASVVAILESAARGDIDDLTVECRQRTKNGAYIWTMAIGKVVERDADGCAARIVAIRFDITERKKSEQALAHIAMHDALTDLPNRTMLGEHLHRECGRIRRDGGQVAMLIMDLDNFKDVNDSLGHAAGDQLLQQLSRRLLECCNKNSEFLARMGGDEFAVIATSPSSSSSFDALGDRIHAAIQEPYRIGGQDKKITASIGIATFPTDDDDVDHLSVFADLALYEAKKSGGGVSSRYVAEMQRQALARIKIDHALQQALDSEQFCLYFQPIVTLDRFDIKSLEVLIRWRHSDGELRLPKDFIPAAKCNNLIIPMTDWVIETAANLLRKWRTQGRAPPPIAVNLPTSHLEMTACLQRISRSINAGNGRADDWIIEVTEDAMANDSKAIVTLSGLRELGVKIAIDDFGTGYSSMARLGALPVDQLKIDRSFIVEFGKGERARSVLKAMTTLATSFDLETVIEGIETADDMAMVRDLGFDTAQGFLFAKPMPAELVVDWLAQWRQRSFQPELDLLRRRR